MLERLLKAVRAGGSRRALVVRGEPGPGKTALLLHGFPYDPTTPPPAPTPRGFQEADQARAFQAAWEAGWNAGWQEGWDLRSAVDVVVWYVNSRVDL